MQSHGGTSSRVAVGQEAAAAARSFKLRVYSRKWGHDDTYTVRRTDSGWHISFIRIGGPCDPTGAPYLFENLRHDEVQYPEDLGQRMHRLWREVPMMSSDEVQGRLDVIAGHLRSHEKLAGAKRQSKAH